MKVLSSQNISDIKKQVPKLYTEYGTNTDGAVTQNFINTKLNNIGISLGRGAKSISSGSDTSINIGLNAISYGYSLTSNVVVGNGARVGSSDYPVTEAVAIGRGAVVEANGGVAIGAISKCTEVNTVSFGGVIEDQTMLKRLCYVDNGIADTDVCTVGQLKTSIADYVPNTRTVNGKALDTNISLTASDVGALPTTGGTMTGGITFPEYASTLPQSSTSKTLRFYSSNITMTQTPVLMIGQTQYSKSTEAGIGLGTTSSTTESARRCLLRGIDTPIHAYDACPKDWVDTHTYAVCRSEANAPVKVVKVPNLVVKAGVVLNVYFTKGSNAVPTPKLSVNGAEALIVNGAYNTLKAIAEREVIQFVYAGGYWSIVSGQPRELYTTLSIRQGGTGSTSALGALKNLGGVSASASAIVASPVVGYYKHSGDAISLSAGTKRKVCQLTLRASGVARSFSKVMIFGVCSQGSTSSNDKLYLGIENEITQVYAPLGPLVMHSSNYFYKSFDVDALANFNVPVGIYIDNSNALTISRLSVVALGCLDSSRDWTA